MQLMFFCPHSNQKNKLSSGLHNYTYSRRYYNRSLQNLQTPFTMLTCIGKPVKLHLNYAWNSSNTLVLCYSSRKRRNSQRERRARVTGGHGRQNRVLKLQSIKGKEQVKVAACARNDVSKHHLSDNELGSHRKPSPTAQWTLQHCRGSFASDRNQQPYIEISSFRFSTFSDFFFLRHHLQDVFIWTIYV